MLKPRSAPEDTVSDFDADDEFQITPNDSWRTEPVDSPVEEPYGAAPERLVAPEPELKDESESEFEAESEYADDPELAPKFVALAAARATAFTVEDEDEPALEYEPEPPKLDDEAEHESEFTLEPEFETELEVEPEQGDEPYRVQAEFGGSSNPFHSEPDLEEPADSWSAAPAVSDLPDPYRARIEVPERAHALDDEPVFVEAEAPLSPAPKPVNPLGDLIASTESALGDASVPRISIHIFCERPDTTAAAEEATRDRRMERASTTVFQGGLTVAVEQYQNQPTPSLVMVESQDHGPLLIQQLDRLAEVCDPGTKVVVIGSHNDIALYRELMRRGVSEYLVPPLQTLQLIRAITTLYADPSAPFVGRQIAFCGARGGVGSSTIAHNLAYTLSERMQTKTVIVDFDLPFGTAGLDFNQDPLQGVADALSQPDRLDPVLLDRMMARCTDRLSLFAAPATLDDDYEISAEAFEEVSSKIRTTAPYIVLDLPHMWSNWMRKSLLTADDVVITATPDLACLRNAKNIVDLMRQTRPNDAPPWLVLNQVGLPGRPEIPTKDFAEALGLEPALIMPFDAKLFGNAANNGQMIEEVNDRSKAAIGLQQLAQILARREPPPVPKKSLFAGLFKQK